MLTITVPTKIPYDVQIGGGLLDGVGTKIRALTKAVRVMLVSDDIVAPLYGARVRASLEGAGFAVSEFVFANGEAQKRLSTLEGVLEQLAAAHFTRSDLVVALGGGVVGDLLRRVSSAARRFLRHRHTAHAHAASGARRACRDAEIWCHLRCRAV